MTTPANDALRLVMLELNVLMQLAATFCEGRRGFNDQVMLGLMNRGFVEWVTPGSRGGWSGGWEITDQGQKWAEGLAMLFDYTYPYRDQPAKSLAKSGGCAPITQE